MVKAVESSGRADRRLVLMLLAVVGAAVLAPGCTSNGDSAPTATSTAEAVSAPSPAPTSTQAPTAAPSPTSTAPLQTPIAGPAALLYRGDPSQRAIALTFDAGSDRGHTLEILRVLSEQGVRASFGVTGVWAEANPDLLNAIAAAGHEFINHGYSHRSFTGLSTESAPLTFEERSLELSRTETTVYRLSNRTTRPLFRPPFGDIDATVQRDAASSGYDTIVMWTIDTLGWNRASREQILERTIDLAEPGAIVVMHVGSESQDAFALEGVIGALHADGYALVPVSELARP